MEKLSQRSKARGQVYGGIKSGLSDTHALYLVKHNDGKSVRLASFGHILHNEKYGRVEVDLSGGPPEDYKTELLRPNQMIWFSPLDPVFHEATQEDERAKQEYKQAVENLKNFPDLDPSNPESWGEGCHLLELRGSADKRRVYRVDGHSRLTRTA